MMIKLNPKIKSCLHYDPPIAVTRHFEDVNTDDSAETQIEQLSWIPALLVSRFLGQFPFLHAEADELFSIGICKVVMIVADRAHAGDKIGAVVNVQCRRAMEDYANSLNTIVAVGTTTRYKNLNRGVDTPHHSRLDSESPKLVTVDDLTETYVADAAHALGIDVARMTLRDKRKMMAVLTDVDV
jgi:hypothetical protein